VKDTILIIEDEERLARLLADYVETAGFPTLEQKAKLKQIFEQR
jgi:DNA-binding response OmpR family regulator